jgi:hypothetical protein
MCVCAFLQLSLTSMRLVLHSGEVFCDECACHFFRMPAEFGYGIARQRNCLACYKLVWWPLLVDLPRTRTLLSPTFWTSRSLQRIHSLGYALHMFSPFPFLPCDVLAVNVWCVCVCMCMIAAGRRKQFQGCEAKSQCTTASAARTGHGPQ